MQSSNNNSDFQWSRTYISSPNIALIKYWGKYNQELLIPLNSSLGLTLNSSDLSTQTTISLLKNEEQDRFWLNGNEQALTKRMKNVLKKIRKLATEKNKEIKGALKIESKNSFPTASGMASSASGLACLAACLNGFCGNILSSDEVGQLARLGSGSACRSICGGLVHWFGPPNDFVTQKFSHNKQVSFEEMMKLSKKCISQTIVEAQNLSFLKVVILLTDSKQKQISSSDGMKLSVQTSELIHYRNQIAERRISEVSKCFENIVIARQNHKKQEQYQLFKDLSKIVIQDSNQFHAICLDTYPPISYLSPFSHQMMRIVDKHINSQSKKTSVAYTFDAGAHCFMFVHEDMLDDVTGYMTELFDIQSSQLNQKAKIIYENLPKKENRDLFKKYEGQIIKPTAIWVTDVGEKPTLKNN